MKKREDLSGKRFGVLLVLRPMWPDFRESSLWYCRCDCGRLTFEKAENLLSGRTESCHCERKRRRIQVAMA